MKLNLGAGRFPLDGFENLNEPTWKAEAGLPSYAAGSVEAVTVSHMLMYLDEPTVRLLLSECWRVLERGGVLRVTEDDTADPGSSRVGGAPGAVYLTSGPVLLAELRAAGFSRVYPCSPADTVWGDGSLIQRWHGDPPDVFHVEAAK